MVRKNCALQIIPAVRYLLKLDKHEHGNSIYLMREYGLFFKIRSHIYIYIYIYILMYHSVLKV